MRLPERMPSLDEFRQPDAKPLREIDEYRLTAWHEAGHALVNTAFGRKVTGIVVGSDRWRHLGWTHFEETKLEPAAEAITWLAGMAGEYLGGNEGPFDGCRTDMYHATRLASGTVGPFLANDALDECWMALAIFFDANEMFALIREVAAQALLRCRLGEGAFRDLLRPEERGLPTIAVPVWNQLSLPIALPIQTPRQRQAQRAARCPSDDYYALTGKPRPF